MSALGTVANLAVIEVQDLLCERGEREIFRGLNFSVPAGTLLKLEGPNGSGKTSALRILAGFLRPAGGAVRFIHDSGEAVEDGEDRGRYVDWLGHSDGLKAQLTVIENAQFFAALFRGSIDPYAALRRVGLERLVDLPASFLSEGQKRRLALARLLLAGRPLWLLDEPLSALDAHGRRLVGELVRQHLNNGGIAIAATHESLGLPGARVELGLPP